MSSSRDDYDDIVTPFQEKISSYFKLPYPIPWLLFSCLLIYLHYLAMHDYTDITSILPYAILGALPCILPTASIWFSKLLERFTPSMLMFIYDKNNNCLEWYESEIRSIFNNKRMCQSGLAMVILMLPIAFNSPLLPVFYSSIVTYILIIISVNFFAGAMIYNMIRIWVMIYRLGRANQIKVSVYQHPLTSVKAVGKLMSKLSFTMIGIYIFGISYQIFTEPAPSIIFVCGFFGIFVLLFFLGPQIEIHKIMSKMKHERLMTFSEHLEESLQKVSSNPNRANLQKVRELFGIQQSLNKMGEWPFDTKLLLTIITTLALPIVIVLIQTYGRELLKLL